MTPTSPQLPNGLIIDERFRIDGPPLGAGGFGTVYPATQVPFGKPVAVKVLERSLDHVGLTRFHREMDAAKRINHPNIVTVLDVGRCADGRAYIAMERLDGETLRQFMNRSGPIPVDKAVALISQVCDALAHAHDLGLVHRDVKPENIILVPDAGPDGYFVKLVDLGLVRETGGGNTTNATEGFVGSPRYASPEQGRGEPVTAASDIYALAAIAYELLAGRPLFTSPSVSGLLVAHATLPPEPLQKIVQGIPLGVAGRIHEALAKDPSKRPATARTFKQNLRATLAHHQKKTASRDATEAPLPPAAPTPARPAPVESAPTLAAADSQSKSPLWDRYPLWLGRAFMIIGGTLLLLSTLRHCG